MARRKVFSAEQIIMKLREAEVMLGKGKNIKEIRRVLEVSEQTNYCWRKEYGGTEHHAS
jgi:putative transposase